MKVHSYPIDAADIDAARSGSCKKAQRNGWQFAATHCKTLQRGIIEGKPYTKVEFELETGRKNQIRVHSEWIGHPIAGDKKYGAQTNPLGRLALHAQTLSFLHPWTGKTLRFTSRPPRPFTAL